MKMIKMALLGGAAMAVTAASAQADDLEALKAQIDSLNTRIAAMETAPSVPTGYQLIAVSEGDLDSTPGLGFDNFSIRTLRAAVRPPAPIAGCRAALRGEARQPWLPSNPSRPGSPPPSAAAAAAAAAAAVRRPRKHWRPSRWRVTFSR